MNDFNSNSESKANIFLIEDDIILGNNLKKRLEKNKFKIYWATSFKESIQKYKLFKPNLIIIDLQLPDGNGFDIADNIKQYDNSIPFIFLTAQTSANYRLKGFDLGAKDYIPKPFHFRELLLRIKQVLQNKIYILRRVKFKEFIIDFDKFSIINQKEKTVIPMSKKDCYLLSLLIECKEKVVSRDEILNKLWGEENFPTNRTIDNSIVRLRQSFKARGEEAIASVRGVGYRWIGELENV